MIPVWLIRLAPYAAAVILVAATHGFAYSRGAANTATKYELQLSQERTRAEQAISAEMAERLRMEQAAREAEQQKQDEIDGIRKDAKNQIDRATADAVAAAASAASLRDQARRTAARCAATSAKSAGAPAGSPPTESAGVVLADVLGRIDARAGELADFAERAAVAGATCERAYDAVR